MSNILKINETELVREPLARQLVTGKNIVVFNIISSEKTRYLNTGKKFDYQDELYEVMNKEVVESPLGYIKFNCVHHSPDAVLASR